MADSVVDLTKTYDAVVIGSGAAGGMACHVLTSHGAKVLLLEAGKKLPIEKELRSMEWPYDNKYRGFQSARLPFAQLQRVHDSTSALRPRFRTRQTSQELHRQRRLRKKHHASMSAKIPTPARTTPGSARAVSAAKPTSGAASRFASPTTTSKPMIATASAKIGRSATATSRPTTTKSISISASPASKRASSGSPTASSSARPS